MFLDLLSHQWFAIQVAAKKEWLVATVLGAKGYEYFLPLGRRVKPRSSAVDPPLFPGYVFCRFGTEVLGPVITTPGVIRIVGFGNRPAPVDDSEIENIRRIEAAGMAAESCSFPKTGERVLIRSGPLTGVEGVLVTSDRPEWLVVCVTLLQRSIRVRLHASWIQALPLANAEIPRALPVSSLGRRPEVVTRVRASQPRTSHICE